MDQHFSLFTRNDGDKVKKFYDIGPQSASESDDGRGGTGLLIGTDLLGADPMTQEEMQRKKEKIMMQSLRRKQMVNNLKSIER
jgi:hypothetical protein